MRDADVVVGQSKSGSLVGRVEELALLDRLLSATHERRAAVAFVTGEAGMGKSFLVAELRRRAETGGVLVATGYTPFEGATLPYASVGGLVRDLARKLDPHLTAEVLAPVQQLMLGPSDEQAGDGQLARIQLFEAVLRAVEGLAAERRLVLVLEDLHWADTGTVELLDYLVRNIDDQAVLIVGTWRSDEVTQRPALRRVLAELRRHDSVTRIDLVGLNRDDVAALITHVTDERPSWTVVDAIHNRSGGNPLFVEELVRASDAPGLPPVLRDLLTGRIEQLPADARAFVAAAAVLGVSSDHRLLARVVDLDADALDSALVGAVRDGVLIADGVSGVVRFRHALLQEAAHAELFPAERVRLHHRAAEALENDPTLAAAGPGYVPAGLAEHRFAAGEWAAACAASIAAAQASMRLYSMHAAHAHLQRAVDAHRHAAGTCVHPTIDDADLYQMAADAAFLVGELESVLALTEAALDAMNPALSNNRAVACWLLQARTTSTLGRHDAALAAITAAESRVADMSEGPEAAAVVTMHARLLMAAGRSVESIARCEEALVLARAANMSLTEGHILATLGPVLADVGQSDRALETMRAAVVVAEEVGDADLIMRAHTNLTHVMYYTGELEELVAVATEAMNDTSPLGSVRLGGVGNNAAEGFIMLGRWAEAARLIALMEGKASSACTSDNLNEATLAIRLGDLDAAETALLRPAPADPQSYAQRLLLVAEIALERGRPEDAAAAVDEAMGAVAGIDAWFEVLSGHAVGLQALVAQAAPTGRPGRRSNVDASKTARRVDLMLEDVERLIDDTNEGALRGSRWVAALVAQCRAEATRLRSSDPSAWVSAAEAWAALGAPFHGATCRLREAEARFALRDDRRAASEALTDAWRTARRLGAATLTARCEQLAQRARVALDDPHDDNAPPSRRVAADLGLTAREVEVLGLLAGRRTDAHIADQLFISKKTASVHVSNILRKLDARDRYHAGDIGRAAGLDMTT